MTYTSGPRARSPIKRFMRDLRQNWQVYLMLLPVVTYFVIFSYMPMGGLLMGFENYRIKLGLLGSKWVGLEHFRRFFSSIYFWRLLRNTLVISLKDIFWSFPLTILFALMLNQVQCKPFLRTVQTVSYLPYFISMVVVCGLVKDFTQAGSPISRFVGLFTGKQESLLTNPSFFQERAERDTTLLE